MFLKFYEMCEKFTKILLKTLQNLSHFSKMCAKDSRKFGGFEAVSALTSCRAGRSLKGDPPLVIGSVDTAEKCTIEILTLFLPDPKSKYHSRTRDDSKDPYELNENFGFKTLGGSFSSVWTATIARVGAFFSIFRDLQDSHSFAPLRNSKFADFQLIL